MAATDPVASTLLSARGLCELVLQRIGAYAVNDEGADPIEMNRTLQWMDLTIAEIAGTDQCLWLVPETLSFEWPAATRTDTLENLLDTALPPTGVLFVKQASLLDSNGIRMGNLPLVARDVYEKISNKDDAGRPEKLFIDRLASDFNASIYRVPDATQTYTIELVVQTYAASVMGNQGQTDQSGDVRHGFSQEWQRFIVNRVGADVGSGPVRRLDLNEIKDMRDEAIASFARLQAYSNRQKQNTVPRTSRYGSSCP